MDVAVVIPAFNAAPYLPGAIQSVLGQTVSPRRVIVVDDGSTDGTSAVAEQFAPRVICVRQSNRGVSAARNRGVREAGTEWIAFLDADDEWLPDKLEHQRAMLDGSGAGASVTALRLIYGGRIPSRDVGVDGGCTDLRALLLHQHDIPQGTSSTLLVRTVLFDAIGGYDESLSTVADWDLLVRLRLVTTFAYVPAPLVLYRRYHGSMSRNVEMLERESVRLLAKVFASPDLPADLRALERRCLAWNDIVLSGSYFWARRWTRAAFLTMRAASRNPAVVGRILGFPRRYARRIWQREPDPHTL